MPRPAPPGRGQGRLSRDGSVRGVFCFPSFPLLDPGPCSSGGDADPREALPRLPPGTLPHSPRGGFLLLESYWAHKQQVLQHQQKLAQATATTVELLVSDLAQEALALSRKLGEPGTGSKGLLSLLAEFRHNLHIKRVGLIGRDGQLVAVDPPLPLAQKTSLTDQKPFQDLQDGRDWVVADLLISRVRRDLVWGIAAAVRNKEGKFLGAAVLIVDPKVFAKLLPRELDEDDDLMILDRNARIIYWTKHPDLPWEERDRSGSPLIKRALAGEVVISERHLAEDQKTPMIVTRVPIASIGWAVQIAIPTALVMSSVSKGARILVGTMAFLGLLSLAASFLLSKRFAKPLEQLTRAAERMAAGDLSQRVEVVGENELAALASSFNRMGEALASSQRALRERAEELARLYTTVLTAKQEWESTFDAVPDPIYIHDAEYRILQANKAFTEWIGLPLSQVIGRRHHEVLAGLDGFCLGCPSARAAEGKRSITDEVVDPRTGKIYWVTTSPARNLEGGICCFVHVARDITEFRQAEEQLQMRNRELLALYQQVEQDRQMKATLLRELNHRVRNNLAAIVGLLEMELWRAGPRTAEEALLACLERVKAIARAHELLATGDFASLDFQEIIEAVVRGAIRQGGDSLKIEVSIQGSPLKLPPKQFIALVFIANELVQNAAKHAFRGREQGRIEVRVGEEGGRYVLEVRDNGVGFSEETPAGKGIGLEIVSTLCRTDLAGDCVFLQDGGTVARIAFPKPVNALGAMGGEAGAFDPHTEVDFLIEGR